MIIPQLFVAICHEGKGCPRIRGGDKKFGDVVLRGNLVCARCDGIRFTNPILSPIRMKYPAVVKLP